MRKNLFKSVLLFTLTIILSLITINVFGESSSVSSPIEDKTKVIIVITYNKDGKEVTIPTKELDVKDVTDEVVEQVESIGTKTSGKLKQVKKLEKNLKKIKIEKKRYKAKYYETAKMFDLVVTSDLQNILDNNGSVELSFSYTDGKNPVVIHLDEKTNEWKLATDVSYKNGQVKATFDSLCPICFLELADDAKPISYAWIFFVIGALLIAAGVAVYFYLKNKKDDNNAPKEESNIHEVQEENDIIEESKANQENKDDEIVPQENNEENVSEVNVPQENEEEESISQENNEEENVPEENGEEESISPSGGIEDMENIQLEIDKLYQEMHEIKNILKELVGKMSAAPQVVAIPQPVNEEPVVEDAHVEEAPAIEEPQEAPVAVEETNNEVESEIVDDSTNNFTTASLEDEAQAFELSEEIDNEEVQEEESHRFMEIEYNKCHLAKVILLDDELKSCYQALRNVLDKYKLSHRVSSKYETFSIGRNLIAKLEIRGKSINMTTQARAEDYEEKYKLEPQKNGTTVLKVKSERKCGYAVKVLEDLLLKYNAKLEKNYEEKDFFSQYKNETEKTLITKGLVKCILSYTDELNERGHQVKMFNKTSVYNIHKYMNDKDALNLVEKELRDIDMTKLGIIYTDTLCKYFEPNETVTLDAIKERINEFDKSVTWIKLKPRGKMDRPLRVYCDAYTLGACKMVEITGGKIVSPSDKDSEE